MRSFTSTFSDDDDAASDNEPAKRRFKPIRISETGLELIEWLATKPLRLKIRNIAGDESVVAFS